MIYKGTILLILTLIAYLILPSRQTEYPVAVPNTFKNMLGVNVFEWNFLQDPQKPGDGSGIYEPKMALIQSFSGVRHYLDWQKIEPEKGKFTFNPTRDGGWNLDTIYQQCKARGLDVLVCLKTCPDWLLNTYPANDRDAENVPMPYGGDKSQPRSYVEQAKAGFQFAARYGYNTHINPAEIAVESHPRWANDRVNKMKIGMRLVRSIECDNERDKWWKGDKAHQTPEEYAANLSAFYDGDKGVLGPRVGVKAADPGMQVVMAGLASTDVKYVEAMINWCRRHRGVKKDGSVNLCFDVVNFHLYANDHKSNAGDQRTVGVPPELSEGGQVADAFVKLARANRLPVWVTEAGYDISPKSPQRAIGIKTQSALITQGDWIARTALLYARHGIQKVFFYELYDDQPDNAGQYESSGLVNNNLTRRPAGNYISQLKDLMGEFSYVKTINQQPLVDQYTYKKNVLYALMMPSQTGSSQNYNLQVSTKQAVVFQLNPFSQKMTKKTVIIRNHYLTVTVTETPVFVELEN